MTTDSEANAGGAVVSSPMTFAAMGFGSAVTAKSANTDSDGYDGVLNGLPYHIDPSATPDAYAALVVAIAANAVTVTAYVAPVVTLSDTQTMQNAVVDAAYLAAIQVDVSFTTAAGVTKTYQADSVSLDGTDSQTALLKAVMGYDIDGAVPSGFAWKSKDNTMVEFTLADLKGLYAAILAQGQAAFTKRATLKAEIAAATTVAAVQAIVWS